jgi:hypothetical protein
MNLAASWEYIQSVANIRRRGNRTPRHIDVEYLETIGAAGEVAARRFLGLPEKLHTGFDKGTDFRWRGWRVDVKTTVLTKKVGYRYLQWPKTKPVKADIIFMVAVDRETSEAVPIGFALKQELLDAPINSERQYPCYEIPFGSLHPAWEMYTVRPK